MDIVRRIAAALSLVALVGTSAAIAQPATSSKSGMVLTSTADSKSSSLSTLNARKSANVALEVTAEGAVVAPVTIDIDPNFPLPEGLDFDAATGTLSGAVDKIGQTLIRFVLTNGNGKKADASLAVGIYNPLTITTVEDIYVSRYDTIDTPIKVNIDPTGVIPDEKGSKLPKVSVVGDTPPGFTYSAILGGFTGGTSAPEGVYGPIALQVTDGSGATVMSNTFNVHVTPRKTISLVTKDVVSDVTRAMVDPVASVNRPPLSQALPISFDLAEGTLPSPLFIDSATGRIVGIPEVPGIYSGLRIRATDGEGFSAVSNAFTLTVTEAGPLSALPRSDVTVAIDTPTSFEASKFGFVVGELDYTSADGLPAGLTMNSNGAISGTPTELTDKSIITIHVRDGANRTASGTFNLSVIGQPTLAFSDASSPLQVAQYEKKTWKLKPANIIGTPTFTLSGGPTPSGFSFYPTGTIAVASETKGTFNGLKAIVTDSFNGLKAELPFSIVVGDRKPVELSYANPATVFVNSINGPITPTINNAKGAVRFELVSGSIPLGMELDRNTGLITGQPISEGRFNDINIKATDSEGIAAQASFNIFATRFGTVSAPPVVNFSYRVGETFTTPAIPFENVVLPIRYALQAAAPGGTQFDPTTGKFSGRFTQPGSAMATVMATDAHDRSPPVGTKVYMKAMGPVSVAAQPQNATIYQYAKTNASIGATFANLIGKVNYTLQGTLPDGLTFDAATGLIVGQASETGVFSGLRILAMDTHDNSTATTNPFSITVLARKPLSAKLPPSVTTLVDRFMADFAATVVANDSYGAGVTYSVSGTLPDGVTFDETKGTFSGKPSMLGEFPDIRVSITDSVGATATSGPMTIKVVLNGDPIGLVVQDIKTHVGWQFDTPTPVVSNEIGKLNFYSYDLIPEIALDPLTGVMSGTFLQPYDFEFDLYVADQTARVTSDRLKVTALPDIRTIYPSTIAAPQYEEMTAATPDVSYKVGTASFAKGNPSAWPAGIVLDPVTGRISGKAEEYGVFPGLTVLVTDAQGANSMTIASNTFTLDVSEYAGRPVIQKQVSNWANPGLRYALGTSVSFTPSVTDSIMGQPWNYPGTVYSINKALPAGMSFDTVTGMISGIPSAAASIDDVVITVTSANGQSSSTNPFWVGVTPAGDMQVSADPYSVSGRPGTKITIPAPVLTNVVGEVQFAKVQGDIQTIVNLNTATGEISVDIPADYLPGTYLASFSAHDRFGRTVNFAHSITVLTPPTATYPNKSFIINEQDTLTPTTAGLTAGAVFSISPALPVGLTLDSNTGVISGRPTALVDATNYTVTITDSYGPRAGQPFTLVVTNEPPADSHRAFLLYFNGLNTAGGAGARIGDITAIGSNGAEITPSRAFMYGHSYNTTAITDGDPATTLFNATTGGGVVMEFDNGAPVAKLRVMMSGSQDPKDVRVCWSENYGWSTGGYFSTASTGPLTNCTAPFTLTSSSVTGGATYAVGEIIDVRVGGNSASLGVHTPPSIAYATGQIAETNVRMSIKPWRLKGITAGTTFSVSPTLPAGISLNASTGEISGTPTTATTAQSYTVTATNSSGSSSSTFSLEISGVPNGYRYWRWACSTVNNGTPNISEMVFYENGNSLLSSISSINAPKIVGTSYDASKTIDNKTTTFMSFPGGSVPSDWVVNITLSAPKNLNSFSMRPRQGLGGGYSCTSWTISYSEDGVNYIPSWSDTFYAWASDSVVRLSIKQ